MVLRLATDQCAMYWEDLKQVIKTALPPNAQASGDGLNEILQGLYTGTMQAWVAIHENAIRAAAITMLQVESGTKTKNLLIYALCGYSAVTQELWEEGFQAFKEFAKANGCFKIVAYTKVPRVLEIAQGLGATSDFRLLEWEV